MACASTLGERGHAVTLIDKRNEIGGQFNYAKQIPARKNSTRHCAISVIN
jgi:2,4-dienoyl-CoA reductase (NADPH2)